MATDAFYCAVCDVHCGSVHRLASHTAGRKHREAVLRATACNGDGSGGGGGAGELLEQVAATASAATQRTQSQQRKRQAAAMRGKMKFAPLRADGQARRVKLVVEYDGSDFKGWQRQPDHRSVQGALEGAMFQLTGEGVDELAMRVAGRTDAGVHAKAQVCTVLTRWAGESMLELGRSLNTRLPHDVAIRNAEEVAMDWIPYNCERKRYRYLLSAARAMASGERGTSPLAKYCVGRQYMWQCPWPLSLELLRPAAAALEGLHDYTSFCHLSEKDNDNVIEVESITLTELEDCHGHLQQAAAGITSSNSSSGGGGGSTTQQPLFLALDFIAHGFRMHMVRNLVGTIVDIGRGRIPIEAVPSIFAAQSRKSAGEGAPSHGLTLMEISYDHLARKPKKGRTGE